jgi:hypothetical protein
MHVQGETIGLCWSYWQRPDVMLVAEVCIIFELEVATVAALQYPLDTAICCNRNGAAQVARRDDVAILEQTDGVDVEVAPSEVLTCACEPFTAKRIKREREWQLIEMFQYVPLEEYVVRGNVDLVHERIDYPAICGTADGRQISLSHVVCSYLRRHRSAQFRQSGLIGGSSSELPTYKHRASNSAVNLMKIDIVRKRNIRLKALEVASKHNASNFLILLVEDMYSSVASAAWLGESRPIPVC